MKQENNLKEIIYLIIAITFLAFIGIFIAYLFYRTSLNPEPINNEVYIEKINSSEKNVDNDKNVIKYSESKESKEDKEKINTDSIIESELKLTEILYSDETKKITNEVNLALDNELIQSKKDEILTELYLKNSTEAINIANNLANNYNFTEYRDFEVFIYEVLEFEDYENINIYDKKQILKKLLSPELILFCYLDLPNSDRIDITLNKESHVLYDTDINNSTLKYISNISSGLYTEMYINNAFFATPKNIEGYKIIFKIFDVEYYLHYIRYKDNNTLDIIYFENRDFTESTTISGYLELQ